MFLRNASLASPQSRSPQPPPKIMSEFVQITTTTGTRQDAEQIAAELVSRRLAGCVQVSGPIASTFHWQGKIENGGGVDVCQRRRAAQLAAIREVSRLHPYEVPELMAMPIVEGGEEYLKWLGEQWCK